MSNGGPSWERKFAEEQQDMRDFMERRGAEESQRMRDNTWHHGDLLGMDDGRAGIGINPAGFVFGDVLTLDWRIRVALGAAGLVVLLLIVIGGQALKRGTTGNPALSTPVAAP